MSKNDFFRECDMERRQGRPRAIIENKLNEHVILKSPYKSNHTFDYEFLARGFVQINDTVLPGIVGDVSLKEGGEKVTVLSAIVVAKWVFFALVDHPNGDTVEGMFFYDFDLSCFLFFRTISLGHCGTS